MDRALERVVPELQSVYTRLFSNQLGKDGLTVKELSYIRSSTTLCPLAPGLDGFVLSVILSWVEMFGRCGDSVGAIGTVVHPSGSTERNSGPFGLVKVPLVLSSSSTIRRKRLKGRLSTRVERSSQGIRQVVTPIVGTTLGRWKRVKVVPCDVLVGIPSSGYCKCLL